MCKPVWAMILLSIACQNVLAQKHVHGQGQLLIAQDQQDWQFQFVLPAIDLLGFEHKPQSPQQIQHVSDVIAKVESGADFLQLPDSCNLGHVSHELADWLAVNAVHSDHSGAAKDHTKHNTHSDHSDNPNHHDSHDHNPSHGHDPSHDHSHDHNHGQQKHQALDIRLTYQFSCRAVPDWVNIRLFEWVHSLNSITAQWITDTKQGALDLSASSPRLKF